MKLRLHRWVENVRVAARGLLMIARLIKYIATIGVNINAFGRKLTPFSAIQLSRFLHKMSRFFGVFRVGGKCALCALFSVKLNSDDSATSVQTSAKLIHTAKFSNVVCCACLLSCDLYSGLRTFVELR